MEIDDGKGRGNKASVSADNRFNVAAKTNPRAFYVSRDEGLTFNLTSVDTESAAGEYVCYLKNTSTTKNIFIKQIHVNAVNAIMWKTWTVTGTAAGTPLIPANMNLSSGRTADVEAYGNGPVTGLTTSTLLDSIRNSVGDHESSIYDDSLILGPNDAIAVEYDSGTTGASEITILLHFEDVGRAN